MSKKYIFNILKEIILEVLPAMEAWTRARLHDKMILSERLGVNGMRSKTGSDFHRPGRLFECTRIIIPTGG